MAGADWAIAFILLAICVIIIVTALLVCRVFGLWKVSTFFPKRANEEKEVLTRSEQYNGYTIGTNGAADAVTTTNVGYDQFDSAPQQGGSYAPEPIRVPDSPPHDRTVEGDSPMSVDNMSIASDYEPISSGIHRAMSCDSVASDSSVFDFEPESPKIGQLEFGLEYDREVCELIISVIQARDLEQNEVTGTLDSYVRLWLTPHKHGKVQTKVQKSTTNPLYQERFLFSVNPEDFDDNVAQFQVFSCDKYARHKLLGETDLRLGDIDLRQAIRIWMNLRDMDERPTDFGSVMFSLSYLPTAERLTVVVVKCRNLKWTQSKDAGDSAIKVYLLQNNKKVGKKKTSTKKEERNPIFNEAMIFSVPADSLQTVQLRLTVLEQLPEKKVASIGHVMVGASLSGTELTHWNQMMTSLRKPVAMWHNLKK